MRRSFDSVVIGGGVIGLSAAWHLGRMGHRVAVIERFRVGHVRGSSHGSSRVARCAYPDPAWADFARASLEEAWPLLERASGEKLLQRQPVVFHGPEDGPIREWARSTAHIPGVRELGLADARARFPQLHLPDGTLVMEDGTGGVIRAHDALMALKRQIVEEGGRVFSASTVLQLRTGGDEVLLETERGVVSCNRAVIAAGPWTGHLMPFLAPALRVIRQSVGHAEVTSPTAAEDFPVWARVGEVLDYGLPAVQRQGVKLARHVLDGPVADSRFFVSTASTEAEQELLGVARECFADPVAKLACTETCLYTVTHNEDFILDLHPADRRIAVAAGFSGHGFKFAPLVGQVLAEMASKGSSGVPTFQPLRERLCIGTHLRIAERAG